MTIEADIDVANYDAVRILEHIIEKHHRYFKDILPVLDTQLHSTVKIDHDDIPNISHIYNCFLSLRDLIEQHIGEEEYMLFPILKKLYASNKNGNGNSELIAIPLKNIINEHEKVKTIFFELEILTSDFRSPANASTTLKETYLELKHLKSKFLKLEQIETELLIPKFSSFKPTRQ
jgi:regulator of cell morphogenesis and NO signaling